MNSLDYKTSPPQKKGNYPTQIKNTIPAFPNKFRQNATEENVVNRLKILGKEHTTTPIPALQKKS